MTSPENVLIKQGCIRVLSRARKSNEMKGLTFIRLHLNKLDSPSPKSALSKV